MKSIRQTLLNNNSPAPQTTSTKMSVYQHWDPLRAIAVGQSYPPELYDYIKNEKVRKVFYQIAEETEEDYQKLISILTKFNVDVVRPDVVDSVSRAKHAIKHNNQIMRPAFMQPRDMSIMIGETFYCPDTPALKPIVNYAKSKGNTVLDQSELKIGQWKHADFPAYMNGAMTTRVGKDLYIGTLGDLVQQVAASLRLSNLKGVHARVETLEGPFDVIGSRAFASLPDFVTWSASALGDKGIWMAMKGKLPEEEISSLPSHAQVFHVEQLHVPGLSAERCMIWMKKSTPLTV